MVAPTFATAPTAEQVVALPCPVDRARVLTRFARDCGTLPAWAAELRTAALVEARVRGTGVAQLVAAISLSAARIYGLTGIHLRSSRAAGQE